MLTSLSKCIPKLLVHLGLLEPHLFSVIFLDHLFEFFSTFFSLVHLMRRVLLSLLVLSLLLILLLLSEYRLKSIGLS